MKQKLTVIFALVTFLVLSALSAFTSAEDEWILLAEDGGVNAYYRLGSCDSRSVMFLKFENTLSSNVKVEFHMVLENNPPIPQVIELQASEIISGQCIGSPHLIKDVTTTSPSPHVTMKLVN